ncbi:perlucin-like [Crassostrea angulata]|uniref:perlucin-like n=1 Tax=Magallana angulata TaxID=2784310 RepID=UPI0022B12E5D|nr:perlucin-like [Crassostrea angulata]
MACQQLLIFICLTGTVQLCCPDGWRKGKNSCYYIGTSLKTWVEASGICQAFHSELVVINDAEENSLLKEIITNIKGAFSTNFWMDGSDQITEGLWVWASTMETIRYTNWEQGEPNNYIGIAEDCLELYLSNFKWNDIRCTHANHFICEKELSTQDPVGELVGGR